MKQDIILLSTIFYWTAQVIFVIFSGIWFFKSRRKEMFFCALGFFLYIVGNCTAMGAYEFKIFLIEKNKEITTAVALWRIGRVLSTVGFSLAVFSISRYIFTGLKK